MAVEAAAPSPSVWTLRLARIGAVPALSGLVVLSFVVRLFAALAHATPLYFPDEYIYGSLARSLATSGKLAIRGAPAHFPALLEPLLAAPFWSFGDPVLAYRLTQGLNVLAMSLAAVPVYLLARRLGLGQWLALGAAAVAVASPDLLYASFVLADPIAYPLVLGAVYLGVRALEQPTRRAQVAFVVVAGLASFARIQYVVLPLAFLGAALVIERGRVKRYWPTLALLAAPVPLVLAVGTTKVLGYYSQVGHAHVPVGAALKWAAIDTMMLAYSAGWILIPGALVGLAYALVRPRTRTEAAFGALTLLLAGGVFVEAAVYAARGSTRYQERYLFALLPLVAPLFGLYVKRGWPRRAAVALVAVAMLALAARVPLSGFTVADNKQDSPFLFAVFRLESALGVGNGSLAVALAAGALSALAVALARRRFGAAVAVALTITACIAGSAGAFVFDRDNAANVRASHLPSDLRWIDRSGLRHVVLVQTAGAQRGHALEQLFWNRSVDRIVLLFGGAPADAFGADQLNVTRDGRLVAGRAVLTKPLLIDTFAARVQLTGVVPVAHGSSLVLFRPAGTPRFSLVASGLYTDGWLARAGVIRVWPDANERLRGTLTLRLWLPAGDETTPLRLRGPGFDRTVSIHPGESRTVTLPVSGTKVWSLHVSTTQTGTLGDGRPISVKVDEPRLRR